ncbi:MAG: hypothetical protein M1834_009590 [Cirrosporium novae-zelandiae]|nr:MAG: hypothetical protein M1834_009590 [Cirrosporium novae-zelandiae]
MHFTLFYLMVLGASALDPLKSVGGNSPWFQGPNVYNIPDKTPEGCSVEQATFVSRHGSRYPDPGAYSEWTTLSEKVLIIFPLSCSLLGRKDLYSSTSTFVGLLGLEQTWLSLIHSASFTANGSLSFIKDWEPVLSYPDQQISEISIGGYKELYDMGVAFRWRYPDFYKDNSNFTMWSNLYAAAPRVIESAQLFARGYMGPNSSYGSIYVINSTDERSLANSLAASDLCNTYKDNSGSPYTTTWGDMYLPPITKRLNKLLTGNLTFDDSDVSIFPYLCGFETQITGSTSPWCSVFTDSELRNYEYYQDLRYWYGSGPGAFKNDTVMLPLLEAIVKRFQDGPNKTYTSSDNTTFTPPKLTAMFTNDGQVNQLVSVSGIFDNQTALPATRIPDNQLYIASHIVPMKGFILFEKLSCPSSSTTTNSTTPEKYIRILLNNAIYPLPTCSSGPGQSCPLSQYAKLVSQKRKTAGSFVDICEVEEDVVEEADRWDGGSEGEKSTFLEDLGLPFEWVVKP